MIKKSVKILSIVVILLFIILAAMYYLRSQGLLAQIFGRPDVQKTGAIPLDEFGKPLTDVSVVEYGPKPVPLEFMNENDVSEKKLATGTRMQVLERNASGTVTAYKIIKDDKDILKEW